MKNYFVLMAFLGIYMLAPLNAGSRGGVEVEVSPDDDYYYDDGEDVVWIGPGWYYGVWFDTEYDYYGWRDGHRHGGGHRGHGGHGGERRHGGGHGGHGGGHGGHH